MRSRSGPVRVFAVRPSGPSAASRPPVPARVGAGGRVADPRARRLRPRRGGGPGGVDVALERWPRDGVPRNPGAWITTTARNRAIDRLRRERVLEEKRAQLAALEALGGDEPDEPDGFPDDRLRLMFTCCHPALAAEARVALTLRTLGGLSVPEIARAFLVAEPAMAQRLVRAKRKIARRRDPLPRARGATSCRDRLPSVLAVVYLVFNEGYAATAGEALVRRELCAEAIRLGRLLVELMPGEARAARPAGADAAPPRAPRRARRRRGAAGAARGPGPLAVGRATRSRRGRAHARARPRRAATRCRRRSRPSTSPTRPTGRTSRRSTRGWPRSTRAR